MYNDDDDNNDNEDDDNDDGNYYDNDGQENNIFKSNIFDCFIFSCRKCGNFVLGKPSKKTVNFMTICQRVGRWQTQNMISFLKEIMTRGWVPESLRIKNLS